MQSFNPHGEEVLTEKEELATPPERTPAKEASKEEDKEPPKKRGRKAAKKDEDEEEEEEPPKRRGRKAAKKIEDEDEEDEEEEGDVELVDIKRPPRKARKEQPGKRKRSPSAPIKEKKVTPVSELKMKLKEMYKGPFQGMYVRYGHESLAAFDEDKAKIRDLKEKSPDIYLCLPAWKRLSFATETHWEAFEKYGKQQEKEAEANRKREEKEKQKKQEKDKKKKWTLGDFFQSRRVVYANGGTVITPKKFRQLPLRLSYRQWACIL